MSSTEPAASASVPSAVPPMPRSWMMRASTGNAVTDIAAPRYIMLCQLDTLWCEETAVGVQKRRQRGAEQERRDDAGQRDQHRAAVRLLDEARVQVHSDDEHVEHETDLADGRQHAAATPAGNSAACADGATRPSSDGPEQDAGDHLADDSGLADARHQAADRPADDQDDGELKEETEARAARSTCQAPGAT